MEESVSLYLASGINADIGFSEIDYSEREGCVCDFDVRLLECYRNELVGIEAKRDSPINF